MREQIIFGADGLAVQLHFQIFQDEEVFIGEAPSLEVSSHGVTPAEALKNIKEAVSLWFESCLERGTLEAALKDLGWHKHGPSKKSPRWELPRIVREETSSLKIPVPA